jgi:hypothetical protein
MGATKDPARPEIERGDEETLAALREHLSDEDAEMLARRMKTSEQDKEHATDWQAVKRRILHRTRKP